SGISAIYPDEKKVGACCVRCRLFSAPSQVRLFSRADAPADFFRWRQRDPLWHDVAATAVARVERSVTRDCLGTASPRGTAEPGFRCSLNPGYRWLTCPPTLPARSGRKTG